MESSGSPGEGPTKEHVIENTAERDEKVEDDLDGCEKKAQDSCGGAGYCWLPMFVKKLKAKKKKRKKRTKRSKRRKKKENKKIRLPDTTFS